MRHIDLHLAQSFAIVRLCENFTTKALATTKAVYGIRKASELLAKLNAQIRLSFFVRHATNEIFLMVIGKHIDTGKKNV